MNMENQEEAAKAWSKWLTELHQQNMTVEEPKPKIRDEFLASLIREFGAEHGTELYQSRSVTKQELTRLIQLLKKFKIVATMPFGTANRMNMPMSPFDTRQGRYQPTSPPSELQKKSEP